MKPHLLLILALLALSLPTRTIEAQSAPPSFLQVDSSYLIMLSEEMIKSLRADMPYQAEHGYKPIKITIKKHGGGSWFQILYHTQSYFDNETKTQVKSVPQTIWLNFQNVAAVMEELEKSK